MDPKQLAAIIDTFLDAEDEILDAVKLIAPFASVLPKPFSLLGDPSIQKALEMLPKLTPFLRNLEAKLNA